MNPTKKILGILGLLIFVVVVTSIASDSFLTSYNLENVIRRTALFGILSIGVAFVIITGGIDLSIGSVVCLVGVGLPWMVAAKGMPIPVALMIVALVSLGVGLMHGLLVTKLRLQPFVVTLCALLLYRGLTRGLTGDQTMGFGNEFSGLRTLATYKIPITSGFGIPMPCLILLIVAVVGAVFLNRTIYGRYLLALGRNEQAAKFSGINTDRMIMVAYVISAGLAGLGGMLFVLPSPRHLGMVMRDCPIPIDVAFVDAMGRVVSIHEMVPEPPRRPDEALFRYESRLPEYPSGEPVQFALETAGGRLADLGLRVGDRLHFPARELIRRAQENERSVK